MSLDEATRSRINDVVGSDDVVLFMKGDPSQPQCGFSAQVTRLLNQVVPNYTTFDVLSDAAVRAGIKEFSQWPTIPQLYIKGEFVGGCDIITEMFGAGELHEKLGLERPKIVTPEIEITETAAPLLQDALQQGGGEPLHLTIDANFQNTLHFGPAEPGDLKVESGGITLLVDSMSSQRAQGVSIDAVETPSGSRLTIQNPNAPAPVAQLEPRELKEMMDRQEAFELIDVRTEEEWSKAHIEGAKLLDAELAGHLEQLPKDTRIVFQCHHGGRSQAAAEHFRQAGFTNIGNLAGGIDAWSTEVDSSVPRY